MGHFEPRWAAWFDGLTLTTEPDGTTMLRGKLADQAALHGVLQRIHVFKTTDRPPNMAREPLRRRVHYAVPNRRSWSMPTGGVSR